MRSSPPRTGSGASGLGSRCVAHGIVASKLWARPRNCHRYASSPRIRISSANFWSGQPSQSPDAGRQIAAEMRYPSQQTLEKPAMPPAAPTVQMKCNCCRGRAADRSAGSTCGAYFGGDTVCRGSRLARTSEGRLKRLGSRGRLDLPCTPPPITRCWRSHVLPGLMAVCGLPPIRPPCRHAAMTPAHLAAVWAAGRSRCDSGEIRFCSIEMGPRPSHKGGPA